jgi:hypothetical protein
MQAECELLQPRCEPHWQLDMDEENPKPGRQPRMDTDLTGANRGNGGQAFFNHEIHGTHECSTDRRAPAGNFTAKNAKNAENHLPGGPPEQRWQTRGTGTLAAAPVRHRPAPAPVVAIGRLAAKYQCGSL